jgi:hypothetical protein
VTAGLSLLGRHWRRVGGPRRWLWHGAHALRDDEASGRLVAVAALLCDNYHLAWRSYGRLREGEQQAKERKEAG